MTSVKTSRAFDILINNDDIEIKSIKSNQEKIPFAFQKRDKIPRDNIEVIPSAPITPSTPTTPLTPSTPSTPSTPNLEKDSQKNLRNSISSFSAISSLSNLPYDERPVPTLYNKIKKAKEEKARQERERAREERAKEERDKKSVSLLVGLSEEKTAQLSWKKSVDDDLCDGRPKSVVSKSSAYDRQLQHSSMTIIAEVIGSNDLNSDSENEYEEKSEINDVKEANQSNQIIHETKVSEDNDSLANNINNASSTNLYPAECIASSIEEIKSNISQVENSSIRASIVTQDQVEKQLSQSNLSVKKTEEDKNQNSPQVMIPVAPEEHELLKHDNSTTYKTNKQVKGKDRSIKQKKEKKSKKSKKNSTAGCGCIIS
ncbi:hypothetical protein H8356DRAFT_1357747 [Neocallimastix lanati (nom. inval.)]|nr:hypothetical protein H8356DRAFT_1357747 [Neocallimastix sp. JGI-2020a]